MKVRVVAIDIANNAEVHEENHYHGAVRDILEYATYLIVGLNDGSTVQYSRLTETHTGPGEWPEDP